ncbi:MAG: hypothetical protein SLAVMIC_00452 [uncultured marine phage]|uniref:Uncharacterized protein n=1 Tax=uncultured marine phage TaxID=707152 RepID=A0A8D9CC45_9VIRU|nr:MAG: hypothetical protein SLAVMIC_00452 [uncultured marine phage]
MKKFNEFINEDVTDGSVIPNENKSKRKLLFVKGTDMDPDYASIRFENKYGGTPVADIIADPNSYLEFNDEGEWELKVMEFGEIDPKFLEFLFRHDMIDYETVKSQRFYFEEETI